MKHSIVIGVFLWVLMPSVIAQKVGVVLSGGGAKGLAHIGVLKALEENDIPIDYLVGTSMGGIIAGGYAAGISPYQLEEVFSSGDFINWVRGKVDERKRYNYGQRDSDPSFARVSLSLASKFDSPLNLLNSSIATDWAINFALAETVARSESIFQSNFDNLFVPLRIVGADVFTQKEIVFDSGVLSDALRVTQTVPFFYRPIKVKNKYLFDGGLYNNFPVDVAQEKFNPDFLIGSNVSTPVYSEYPYDEDEKLISKAIPLLLLNKPSLSKVSASDVYIQPDLKGYTAFDFQKARQLIDSGYNQTLRQIEKIKSKIDIRKPCEDVQKARNVFNSRAKPLLFDHILFEGFKKGQQRYLLKFFRDKEAPLSFSRVKSGYYKLMSETYFRHIYPNIIYDSVTHYFDFRLTNRPKTNFELDIGGAVANRNVSFIFLGLHHFYFDNVFIHSNLDIYVGDFHKSVGLRSRLHIPAFNQVYFIPQFIFNSWHFLQDKGLVLGGQRSLTILNSRDYRVGLATEMLLGRQYKASLYGFYIQNHDEYLNDETLASTDTVDNLDLAGGRLGIQFFVNTLNRKQYASTGKHFRFYADWFFLKEKFVPGSTSVEVEPKRNNRRWLRVRATMEQYFKIGKIYHLGYYLDGVFSNQPVLANYQGSLINAPAFNPMQDSRSLLLRNFRSFNYIAGGLRNIFPVYKNFDIRLEGYLFIPFEVLMKGPNQEGVSKNPFEEKDLFRLFFATTVNLVYHTAIGPISLSVNYYDDAYSDTQNRFGVMGHIGFLLFNRAALE